MITTVLEEIVANKRIEIAELKKTRSIADFTASPLFSRETISLRKAIEGREFGIIAEIKRKSPSGGDIHTTLDPIEMAQSYVKDGAAAISILTDFNYFGGSIQDVTSVRPYVNVPLLRKEFIIDEIQLFEAKAHGADAILLIAAILEKDEAHHLTIVAKSLGLEVLFEVHLQEELEKINDEVDLIAVNNRDLHRQKTTLDHSFNLAPLLPTFAPLISASGIQTPDEIRAVRNAGFQGGLIGESVLRQGHLNQLTSVIF